MRIIDNKVRECVQEKGLDGIYKAIRDAAYVCYQSDTENTKKTPKEFVYDVLIKNGHCYSGDVDVLTNKGWIKWRDYNNEAVATVDPATMCFNGFQIPNFVIKKEYDGKFYNYKDIGVEVTDGHRMYGTTQNEWLKDKKTKNYFFECNKHFVDNNGRTWTYGERPIRIPTCCYYDNTQETNPYYELIGFWIGDGSYGSKNVLRFHLKKKHKIDYLRNLCLKLGYSLKENTKTDHYEVHYDNLSQMNELFRKGKEKNIPIDLTYNPIEIYSIFQGLFMSDGVHRKGKRCLEFSNTSPHVIEWCKTMGVIVGYNVIESKSRNNLRNITFRERKTILLNDSRRQISRVAIKEKKEDVYCVNVNTGLIVVRGINGQTILCGNCRPLEFGTVYLIVPKDDVTLPETRDMFVYVVSNPWTKIDGIDDNYFVTTNMRVIMQGFYPTDEEACQNNYNQNFLPLVEKYLADVEFPEYLKRRTYSLILSRGASDDLRTHITLSSICESSRYCNYSKGKFGGQMTAIKPYWMNVEIPEDGIQSEDFITFLSEEKDRAFIKSMENEEYEYLKRSKEGYEAQQLKRLFPLWGKCELRLCGFNESFDNFMWRRLDSHADPECTNVARLIEETRQNKMGGK